MNIEKLKHCFRHCPRCGRDGFQKNEDNSMKCTECGFEFFFNAAAAVAGLIVDHDNRLLVAVRAQNPGKGMLDLPGGFVNAGESAEAALKREIREELNLNVEHIEYFLSTPNQYHYKDVTYSTLDLAYICHVADFSQVKPMDDVQDVLFLPLGEIEIERFAFESIRLFISAFRNGRD